MSHPDSRPPGDGAAGAVPVCPRHPDRESYVRCQRCERPVCPQCQRQAAVGVQCVDCVREQARSMPVARTRFGGRIGSGEATATKWIIGVCVAVYLVELAFPAFMYTWLAFTPGPADLPSSFAGGAWWQPLTAAFLHSTPLPLHLMFNMYALYIVGPYLEQRLGRSRFLATYLLSALGGSVLVLLLHAAGGVGASGAVFGLFGSWFVVNRRLGVSAGPVLALIAINLVLSFTIARISWQAHVGGLITGVALTAILVYAPARNRVLVQWSGIGAVAVVLLALLVVGAVAMQA